MTKKLGLISVILLLASAALAADSKSVSYKSGDETEQGIVYAPAGKGPFPGLIVIHEWWGLNDWVKEQASKLSDQGYVALAADLYRGKAATTSDQAHEITRGVPEDRAKRDLHAAFEFFASQPNVRKDRIGAIGWCMGGGYSLDVALQEPTLAADVINYGHLATDRDALKKINAPILGLFGAQDRGITPDDVHRFGEELDQLGKKIDVNFTMMPVMRLRIPTTKRDIVPAIRPAHGIGRSSFWRRSSGNRYGKTAPNKAFRGGHFLDIVKIKTPCRT